MPAPTASYVKNTIRRGLREIVDPSPSRQSIDNLWSFFKAQCAYCGRQLAREKKEGHVDHLVSSSKGGENHISNRVLSCANCNEKEKLDAAWEPFLAKKNIDQGLFRARRRRILEWQRAVSKAQPLAGRKLAALESLTVEAIAAFDAAVTKARKIR